MATAVSAAVAGANGSPAPSAAGSVFSPAVPRIRFVPKLRGCRPLVNLSRGPSGASLARLLLQVLQEQATRRDQQQQTQELAAAGMLLQPQAGHQASLPTSCDTAAVDATAGASGDHKATLTLLPYDTYRQYLRRLLQEGESCRRQPPVPSSSHRQRYNILSVNSVLRPVSQHLSSLCRFHPEALGCSVMSNAQVYIYLLAWWRLYQRRLARVRRLLQREGPRYGVRRLYIHRMQRVVGDLSRCFESICHQELQQTILQLPLPSSTHRLRVYRRVTTPGAIYSVPKKTEGAGLPVRMRVCATRTAAAATGGAAAAAAAASSATWGSTADTREAASVSSDSAFLSSRLGVSTFGVLDEFCVPPASSGGQPRLSSLLRIPRQQRNTKPTRRVAGPLTSMPPPAEHASEAATARRVHKAEAAAAPPLPAAPNAEPSPGVAVNASLQREAASAICSGKSAIIAAGRHSERKKRLRGNGAFAASCVRRLLLRGTSAGGCSFVMPQCTDTRVTADDVRTALLLLLRTHCVLLPRSLPMLPPSSLGVAGGSSVSRPPPPSGRSGVYRQLQGIPQGANLSGLLCALFYAAKDRHPDVQSLLRGQPDARARCCRLSGPPESFSPPAAHSPQPTGKQQGRQLQQAPCPQQSLEGFELLWEAAEVSSAPPDPTGPTPHNHFVACGPFLFEISRRRRSPGARKAIATKAQASQGAASGKLQEEGVVQHQKEQESGMASGLTPPQTPTAASEVAMSPPQTLQRLPDTSARYGATGEAQRWRSLLRRARRVLLPPLLLRWVDDFVFASPDVSAATHFLQLLTERQMWGPNVNAHKLRVEVDAEWEAPAPARTTTTKEAAKTTVAAATATEADVESTAGVATPTGIETTKAASVKAGGCCLSDSGGERAGLCWAGLELTIPSAGRRLECKAARWKDPQQLTLRDAAALRRRRGCGFMSVRAWPLGDPRTHGKTTSCLYAAAARPSPLMPISSISALGKQYECVAISVKLPDTRLITCSLCIELVARLAIVRRCTNEKHRNGAIRKVSLAFCCVFWLAQSMLERPLFGFLRARLGTPLFLDLRLSSLRCVMHNVYIAVRLCFQRLVLSVRRITKEFGGFVNPRYLLGTPVLSLLQLIPIVTLKKSCMFSFSCSGSYALAGLSRRLVEYSWLFLRAHARPAAAAFAAPRAPAAPSGASCLTRTQHKVTGGQPPLTARAVHARLRCIATFAAARVFKQRRSPTACSRETPPSCTRRSAAPAVSPALSKIARASSCTESKSEAVRKAGRPAQETSRPAASSRRGRKSRGAQPYQAAFSLCHVELLRLTRRGARAAFGSRSCNVAEPERTHPVSGAVARTSASCSDPSAKVTAFAPAVRDALCADGHRGGPQVSEPYSGADASLHRSSGLALQQTRELLKELRSVALHAERENPQGWPRCARSGGRTSGRTAAARN